MSNTFSGCLTQNTCNGDHLGYTAVDVCKKGKLICNSSLADDCLQGRD